MSSKHKKKSKNRSQSQPFDGESKSRRAADEGLVPKNAKFALRTSKLMGRYMVASKDLCPGEVILTELPLVVGPCTGCKVQCLGCYKVLTPNDYTKCPSCLWPLCSKNCKGINVPYGHTKQECALLKNTGSAKFLPYDNFEEMQLNFYCIVPLRCLLLKQFQPKAYEQLIKMEHHNDIRRNIPDVWNANQTIVDRLVTDYGLGGDKITTEEEVHTICGILEVNAFEIGQGIAIRGLYPTAFLMSHNCVPNTTHCDEEVDYRLTVRASTSVKSNQPITLSYAYTLQSTLKRRDHLLTNKFFDCLCHRCADRTELGTHLGALLCPKCKNGLVLADQPLNADSTWSCQSKKCVGYSITANAMELLTNRILGEIDKLHSNDIEGLEGILLRYRNVLHTTHYLNLEVKLNLSQLYGKINGYLIHDLSDELMQRKLDICREILKVFDVLEPGYTRIRGVTLYELHAPLLILTTRLFERHLLSKNQLRSRIREVVRLLEESSTILSNEPPRSSEGQMGLAAKDALKRMQDWLTKL